MLLRSQTEIAKQIIYEKADYVLALKANHPTLYSQVKQWFEGAVADNFSGIDVSYDKRIEKAHHRTEIREVWAVPVAAISELYQQLIICEKEDPDLFKKSAICTKGA